MTTVLKCQTKPLNQVSTTQEQCPYYQNVIGTRLFSYFLSTGSLAEVRGIFWITNHFFVGCLAECITKFNHVNSNNYCHIKPHKLFPLCLINIILLDVKLMTRQLDIASCHFWTHHTQYTWLDICMYIVKKSISKCVKIRGVRVQGTDRQTARQGRRWSRILRIIILAVKSYIRSLVGVQSIILSTRYIPHLFFRVCCIIDFHSVENISHTAVLQYRYKIVLHGVGMMTWWEREQPHTTTHKHARTEIHTHTHTHTHAHTHTRTHRHTHRHTHTHTDARMEREMHRCDQQLLLVTCSYNPFYPPEIFAS